MAIWFQLTAARRRLEYSTSYKGRIKDVSTHSRPKAAGVQLGGKAVNKFVSTHSRPKAAGAIDGNQWRGVWRLFQLTAARRRLGRLRMYTTAKAWFQLTAARRRLDGQEMLEECSFDVSTHSRPKAAGGLAW